MQAKRVNQASGNKTKDAVVHSALKLFTMSGYDGVSVRAIASDAGVNVALVSYYFGGKQGLLEYLMAAFFEGYLSTLEDTEQIVMENKSAADCLTELADQLIRYQQHAFYLSRFVHREMTFDNQLVRELMSSYLIKEKFLFINLFQHLFHEQSLRPIQLEFAIIHYRDLIIQPFLQPQYFREVFFMQPSEPSFRIQYLRFINEWACGLDRRLQRA
ncbi:forespore capture DNA-binding protein RefZ [Sporolactobacillus inulinus]|uniref:Transcriptional regulator n=1 Tax=Sporolactobacillus inulinus CASD TaxID=1069536 RepID=A0A0U1QPY2_9BACL|nr:forespore capture DNA-binding protein RefZ [Sporolactobacillus inulinus]KLI02859.1 transcriptional regulator [Sporolactobacillus inulinus CASD]GEB75734.1 putative HTH-type transcriptional regulator YttP [Sporolactobacillus inulinus]